MRFEKFLAPDMPGALAAVKAAMGPDAVIVAIQELPRRGFWRRPQIEVTATRGSDMPQASELSARVGSNEAKAHAGPPPKAPQAAVPATHLGALATQPPPLPSPGAGNDRRALLVQLEEELAQAREALRQRDEQVMALTASQKLAPKGDDEATLRKQVHHEFTDLKRMLTGITLGAASLGRAAQQGDRSILEAADVDPEVAEDLVRDLARDNAQASSNDPCAHRESVARLKDAIAFAMPTVGDFFAVRAPRRIALVGPTGVGKTTTVAKIAAHAALKHDLRVALVGLDTYRIGASEQLGHYARLIGVPVKTAFDRASFDDALVSFASYDLVLIDTAGRGPNQAGAHCLQLRQLFEAHNVELYLTLAAATRRLEREEMLEAMGDLAPLNARALVLTKLDEAVALGSALSLTHATGLPLAFVTSGQRVPEDLSAADAASLAEHMVERVLQSRGQVAQRKGGRGAGRASVRLAKKTSSQGVHP